MKLTFKDLKQQKFTIDAEPSETIGALKEKISKEKGAGWDASTQKLIYSGKILQDDNTIESYKIEEKGFIVCMTSKPKPAPKPAAAPATPAQPVSTPAAPAAPVAPAAPSANTAAQPPSTPTPRRDPTADNPAFPDYLSVLRNQQARDPQAQPSGNDSQAFTESSTFALGEQRAAAIASMEGMGFPRDQIDRAMRAAFFNPDRAVEYLLNGIPESAQQSEEPARPASRRAPSSQQQQQQTPTRTAATTETGTGTGTGTGGGDDSVNLFEAAAQRGPGGGGRTGAAAAAPQGGAQNTPDLDFLRSIPQFQQLRQVVQQQPQMLEPILQQVAAGNPQLAQIITQNPEQFMQLLAEDADDDVALPQGVQQISVTEEEREAIERLCRLGFERDLVIQAYFACDKNEELAANFLFEQPDEPDEPGSV